MGEASAILIFEIDEFQSLGGFWRPVLNEYAKFQQNPTTNGRVILGVILCKCVSKISRSRLEWIKPHQIRGAQMTIIDAHKFVLRVQFVAPFQNRSDLKVKFCVF